MMNTTTEATVSLDQVLASREQRASLQQAWLSQFEQTVISVTLVWPGDVKDTALSRQVMDVANESLAQLFHMHHWSVEQHQTRCPITGPEAFWSLSAPAWMVKHVTTHLEDTHPLGRLWDIDVFCPMTGLLQRKAIKQPMRRCFICDEPAHVCSRMRRHSQPELMHVIEELTRDYFSAQK